MNKIPLLKNEIYDIGLKAYIFAYPFVLLQVTKEMSVDELSEMHLNRFAHMREFPTTNFHYIVRPNVDTLYSNAWLDLNAEPIILSVPDTHDRYYLMEMLDAWTNVFASIGKRTTGTQAQQFAIVGPDCQGTIPNGLHIIHAPTNTIWILGRTQTNGKKDYAFVHKIQDGYTLTPLTAFQQKKKIMGTYLKNISKSSQGSPSEIIEKMDIKTFYTLFVEGLRNNPPAKDDAPLLKELHNIGIVAGKDFESKQLSNDVLSSLEEAKKDALKIFKDQSIAFTKPVNGWNIMRSNIGIYGTDYLMRAIVAFIGIGANLPEDAVYPTAFIDGDGNQLHGTNAYVIHFNKDEIPPVNAFWSVTLYDKNSFLVSNPIDRYALGDRDPLTYNDDGSLDIWIQSEEPNVAKKSNWLPSSEDNFNVTLRLYWPKESVLNGAWNPPAIVKINR